MGTLVKALTSRQTRRGSNTLIMVVAFIAIVGLLNFLASRYFYRWDLTESGMFTLSPQTKQVLANLKEPVTVKGFFTPQSGWMQQSAEDLLKEYAAASDKFTYEFIDIDQRPTAAQQYNVTREGLLFLSGSKRQEVWGTTESDFTNAIIKVTSAQTKKVAFITGHGERSPDGTDQRTSYSMARDAIQADNYQVTSLSLLSGPVPEDVAAVVLAAPRSPLGEQERQTLRDYLKRGGKLLLLIEPGVEAQLDDLLVDYGVSMGRDLVVDVERALYPDPGTPVITEYGWSPVTKDLGQTVFPGATALTVPSNPAAGIVVTPLARTSGQSWTTKDPRNPQFKEGDTRGPLTLAASIEAEVKEGDQAQASSERQAPKTRLVVVGDSDFAANQFLRLASNRDFLLNAINWLTEAEDLIAIRPKAPEDRTLFLTPTQSNVIWLTSIVLLPLIVLAAGVSVWWSRR